MSYVQLCPVWDAPWSTFPSVLIVCTSGLEVMTTKRQTCSVCPLVQPQPHMGVSIDLSSPEVPPLQRLQSAAGHLAHQYWFPSSQSHSLASPALYSGQWTSLFLQNKETVWRLAAITQYIRWKMYFNRTDVVNDWNQVYMTKCVFRDRR